MYYINRKTISLKISKIERDKTRGKKQRFDYETKIDMGVSLDLIGCAH